ncbi:opy2-like protein [Apiospora kogelbergensis]|uniref:Opy2-like protein n=1 Tax=Apiospora kogelbergensis TaxID=1337665 RepID=A0AAW0QAE5_9PEZI
MARHGGFASDTIPSLFARQEGCLDCLNVSPTCPQCKDTEVCQFTSKSCHACPQAYCALDPDAVNQKSSGSGSSSTPNTGAIVGGVIGGLAAIAIVTYLVWRFCIKNKRGDYQGEQWQTDPEHSKERAGDDMASRRSARQSTHSVHSLASTVLTRASNIIQIAYIPGVTNRATPTSPTVLVPPVPPIPLAHSESGSPSPYQEQHFFVPGDLRDSTYSGISGYSDRTSFARTSYAPRSSVASTIYGKNAVISPMPAQKGTLLKPSIISVKSKAGSSGESVTPPVPSVDYSKFEKPPPSPAFSIGATFFKNASASTATAVRPQVVRVGSGSGGPKQVSIKTKTPTDSIAEEAEGAEGSPKAKTATRESKAITVIEDTPAVDQGPFSDPPKSPETPKSPRTKSDLSGLIEEATRRAAESRTNSMASAPRSMTSVPRECTSPFGDQHAVKE